ncbi:MAG: mannose-6-phosphate isomerase, class I [Spirochaetaceae bacterium]|nr:mannose-6-phosphate isomerase, class I [Spirochaetaceae bacterium]MDT8297966.1 mannose-6-phosphate isomerase, class I [Spirochaetaceae bacterium]
MDSFYRLENTIREYAWGHKSHLPEFLGMENPGKKPMAELWMGAHPSAPSAIRVDGRTVGLDDWLDSDPVNTLGADVYRDFGGLPFLFKLLAAGSSLSIQAHPDKKTAEEGFQREDESGIPRDAGNRNYRDDNHKPEIIMALTTFTAMIGFRHPQDILGNFKELGIPEKELPKKMMENLSRGTPRAMKEFLSRLLTSEEDVTSRILDAAVRRTEDADIPWGPLQCKWVRRLSNQFPGDVGVLAPLFLNVLELKPGEALYQPARALHAYLEGFGVELMANSDNVLRGGLTPKNIDVPELVRVLDFEPTVPGIITPGDADENGWVRYDTPAREFALAVSNLSEKSSTRIPSGTGPSVILVLEGKIVLDDETNRLELNRGESAFIPWKTPDLFVRGVGRVSLASVKR